MARAYSRFQSTGQQQPIFGREAEMQPNAAGGYAFTLTCWQRLERFLILGSDGGTYYVGERKLTLENAQAAIEAIREDGLRAVNLAATIYRENRAPRVDPALFVLALALKHGDLPTRRLTAAVTLPLLRTGSQMLSFAAYLKATGGTNSRIKRRVLANWFNSRKPEQLAFQFVKYQQRNGWSQKDVLRLAHPNPADAQQPDVQRAVYARIVERDDPCLADLPPLLQHFDQLRIMAAQDDPNSAVTAALLGIDIGLPREALPTAALADLGVLRALLPTMPPHALLRNLARLARQTLLTERRAIDYVCRRLADTDWLKRGHVHPFAVMLAALVYSEGRTPEASYRARRTEPEQPWSVQPEIVGALSSAFEALINAQPRSDVRVLYALDCSGSMQAPAMGTPVRCDKAGAAMILALGRPQPRSRACLFTTYCRQPVPIATDMTIDDMIIGTPEGTDCAAPVQMALDREKQPYDAIVIFTDSETWYGPEHMTTVFQRYKQLRNKDCKLVVCAMTSSNANIVDPQDPQQLGIVGLDGNIAMLINSFIGAGQLALAEADDDE